MCLAIFSAQLPTRQLANAARISAADHSPGHLPCSITTKLGAPKRMSNYPHVTRAAQQFTRAFTHATVTRGATLKQVNLATVVSRLAILRAQIRTN